MSAETELLWPGAALLLLLGVVASLCVRCSRPGKAGFGVEGGHGCNGREDGVPRGPCRPRPGCG